MQKRLLSLFLLLSIAGSAVCMEKEQKKVIIPINRLQHIIHFVPDHELENPKKVEKRVKWKDPLKEGFVEDGLKERFVWEKGNPKKKHFFEFGILLILVDKHLIRPTHILFPRPESKYDNVEQNFDVCLSEALDREERLFTVFAEKKNELFENHIIAEGGKRLCSFTSSQKKNYSIALQPMFYHNVKLSDTDVEKVSDVLGNKIVSLQLCFIPDLSDKTFDYIAKCKKLEYLEIVGKPNTLEIFKGDGFEKIKTLPIKDLIVRGARNFGNKQLELLKEFKSLRYLWVLKVGELSTGLSHLGQSNIRRLDINTELLELEHFPKECPKLKVLYLSNAKDGDLKYLPKSLRKLSLSRCNISKVEEFFPLKELENLETLDIVFSQFTKDCIKTIDCFAPYLPESLKELRCIVVEAGTFDNKIKLFEALPNLCRLYVTFLTPKKEQNEVLYSLAKQYGFTVRESDRLGQWLFEKKKDKKK